MLPSGEVYARTMAFATLVVFQMWNVLNCKAGERSVLSRSTFNNPYVWGAIVASFALLATIMYLPFLRELFSIVPLATQDWGLILVWTVPVVVAVELRKAVIRLTSRGVRESLSRTKNR
jgi:Ca2+-transporting ATPase